LPALEFLQPELWPPGNAEFFQSRGDLRAMRGGVDLLVNRQDLAILTDVKGPAGWGFRVTADHPVGPRHFLVRIAQDWIIQVQ
jgi:hypothetical protein